MVETANGSGMAVNGNDRSDSESVGGGDDGVDGDDGGSAAIKRSGFWQWLCQSAAAINNKIVS